VVYKEVVEVNDPEHNNNNNNNLRRRRGGLDI
jgi:hypothetical protein